MDGGVMVLKILYKGNSDVLFSFWVLVNYFKGFNLFIWNDIYLPTLGKLKREIYFLKLTL